MKKAIALFAFFAVVLSGIQPALATDVDCGWWWCTEHEVQDAVDQLDATDENLQNQIDDTNDDLQNAVDELTETDEELQEHIDGVGNDLDDAVGQLTETDEGLQNQIDEMPIPAGSADSFEVMLYKAFRYGIMAKVTPREELGLAWYTAQKWEPLIDILGQYFVNWNYISVLENRVLELENQVADLGSRVSELEQRGVYPNYIDTSSLPA